MVKKQQGNTPGTAQTAHRPTLKTIASMTNLGVTTVSRALKDAPDISQRTKQRVRLVADEVGYTPNRAGVGLRTGKTNVITLALSLEEEIMGLTSHLVRGIAETLSGTPYHLTITPHSRDKSPLESIRYIVETRSADGIILSRTHPDDPRVNYLHKRRVPFATHGRTNGSVVHPFHDFDNERYMMEAIDRLVLKGRSNIAVVAPPEELTYHRHTMQGYNQAIKQHALKPFRKLPFNIENSLDEIEVESHRLFSSAHRPDGIISLSGGSTIAICCGLEKAGLKVGHEVDIVSKQNVNILPRFRKDIEIVNEDMTLAGKELAQQVIDSLNGIHPGALQSVVYSDSDT